MYMFSSKLNMGILPKELTTVKYGLAGYMKNGRDINILKLQ